MIVVVYWCLKAYRFSQVSLFNQKCPTIVITPPYITAYEVIVLHSHTLSQKAVKKLRTFSDRDGQAVLPRCSGCPSRQVFFAHASQHTSLLSLLCNCVSQLNSVT